MAQHTSDEIREKLKNLGAGEEELDAIIKEVSEVIMSKVFQEYISGLPDNLREEISSLSETESREYIHMHQEEFPVMHTDELEKVSQQTWDDYFSHQQGD